LVPAGSRAVPEIILIPFRRTEGDNLPQVVVDYQRRDAATKDILFTASRRFWVRIDFGD
jgi:hypothetical protein